MCSMSVVNTLQRRHEALAKLPTDTNFAISWKGNYHIEDRAFVYTDRESGRVTAILGYPTAKITQLS
jgi:hypothetical protein